MIQAQCGATMRTLQEYTRLKARARLPDDLAWLLVLDAMLFQAEAEVGWLDHCEASLVRHAPQRPSRQGVRPPGGRVREVATEVTR